MRKEGGRNRWTDGELRDGRREGSRGIEGGTEGEKGKRERVCEWLSG